MKTTGSKRVISIIVIFITINMTSTLFCPSAECFSIDESMFHQKKAREKDFAYTGTDKTSYYIPPSILYVHYSVSTRVKRDDCNIHGAENELKRRHAHLT